MNGQTYEDYIAQTTEGRKAHPSYTYRQGNGWIICTWDSHVQCYRTSGETSYWIARAEVAEDNCPGGNKCRHAEQHTRPYGAP